jgi:DNA-binding beta-propeller fold protein YncE
MLINSAGTVTNTITVGAYPYSICYIPTVDKIAVANLSSSNVMFLKTI